MLNAPFGALGHTVHDVLWADCRLRDGEGIEARRLDEVDTRGAVLDRFEQAAAPLLARFGNIEVHPWWGVTEPACQP